MRESATAFSLVSDKSWNMGLPMPSSCTLPGSEADTVADTQPALPCRDPKAAQKALAACFGLRSPRPAFLATINLNSTCMSAQKKPQYKLRQPAEETINIISDDQSNVHAYWDKYWCCLAQKHCGPMGGESWPILLPRKPLKPQALQGGSAAYDHSFLKGWR